MFISNIEIIFIISNTLFFDYITTKYKNVAPSQIRMQIGYKIREVVRAEEKKKNNIKV